MPSALILYHFFHPDDVISAQHFSQLAEELVKRGWSISVLTSNRFCHYPNMKIPEREEWWNGVRVIRVRRPGGSQVNGYLRLINSLWMMAGWTIKLFQIPPVDVVIIGTAPPFSAILFPVMKFFKKGKVSVHWCHDLYPEAVIANGDRGMVKWFAENVVYVIRLAYKSVDLMVDIGPCMRRRLAAYHHKAKSVTIVPWGLIEQDCIKDPDPVTRLELFGDSSLALLYSGNMGRPHDFYLFLKLAKILYGKDPNIILCFACRGSRMDELKKAIKLSGCKNIRTASFVEEFRLEKRLNAADIHLVSLRPEWEGIVVPSKFPAALAAGKPVIYAGPEGSSIAKWVKEFNAGWILSENNLEGVAQELKDISNNRYKLKVLRENAYRAYYDHFSKEIVMDQWDKILKKAIGV